MLTTEEANWIKQNELPINSYPLTINGNMIYFAFKSIDSCYKTEIAKYSIANDEFEIVTSIYNENMRNWQKICIDKQYQNIYICEFGRIWKDMELTKTNLKSGNTKSFTIRNANFDYAQMVYFRNNLHFISILHHSIFNETKQELVTLNKHGIDFINCNGHAIDSSSLVLIALETKGMMILFGGKMNKPYLYKCPTNKWIQSNMIIQHNKHNIYSFGHVVTMNEKYIIIFGGRSGGKREGTYEPIDDIYCVDVDKMRVMKSKICLPRATCRCKGIIMKDVVRDKLIVFGYVRDCWKDDEYVHLRMLPDYLIKMISGYYGGQYLHVVMDRTLHYKINIDRVLQFTDV